MDLNTAVGLVSSFQQQYHRKYDVLFHREVALQIYKANSIRPIQFLAQLVVNNELAAAVAVV